MADYLNMRLSDEELKAISTLGLAHIGDAVFELMVRSWLCSQGVATAKKLHLDTVSFVSAKSQAGAIEKLLPELSEEETAVFKRGRNAHVNSTPRGSSYEEYHMATGLEALFGYLYLKGETARLGELFARVISTRKGEV